MSDSRPGLNRSRLIRLMRASIERCALDLSGARVLTEAASGVYAVTPVLAAMAGAEHVYAFTRSTRHGSASEIKSNTEALASVTGVASRVEVVTETTASIVHQADIVTNCGNLRPIDAEMAGWMKPTAVVPLMYEAWEFRATDVDLASCRSRGIAVAGTNERHPTVDVFSYLGAMAVQLLVDAGIAVYRSRVLLLCDNDFSPFIERGLRGPGAEVDTVSSAADGAAAVDYDVILVALKPRSEVVLSSRDAAAIAERWPGAVVAQYWGDIERSALAAAGVHVWPAEEPARGHMGILPSALGPEPIIRLQSGGLKVGEMLWRLRSAGNTADECIQSLVQSGRGQALNGWNPSEER